MAAVLFYFGVLTYSSRSFFCVFLVLTVLSLVCVLFLVVRYRPIELVKPKGSISAFAISGIGALILSQVDIMLIRSFYQSNM